MVGLIGIETFGSGVMLEIGVLYSLFFFFRWIFLVANLDVPIMAFSMVLAPGPIAWAALLP